MARRPGLSSNSLADFAQQMNRRADEVQRNTTGLNRRVTLSIIEAIVRATPIDTGKAKINWQVGLNSPVQTIIDAPSSPSTAASTANSSARTVMLEYNSLNHTTVHITNNLPYIGRLNDGWSRQAPANFVERAIEEGAQSIPNTSLLG